MKSHSKPTTKKFPKALLIGGTIVLLVAIYAVTAHAAKLWPFNTSTAESTQTTNTPTTQTQPTTTDTTTSNTPAQSTTSTAKTSDTGTTSIQPSTGGISITTKRQGTTSSDADTLYIRALIPGTESTGTCTLTLTKGSATPITLTSGIQAENSSSTCQGFDVSISGHGMTSGTWNIALSFTSGTLQGSTSDTVLISS